MILTSRVEKSEEERVKTPFNRNFYSAVRERRRERERDHRLRFTVSTAAAFSGQPLIAVRSFVRSRHLTTLSPEASKGLPHSLKRVK